MLVTGVHQCGKTYIIKEFGKREFEDIAYINFDENTGLRSVFDYDFDEVRIVHGLYSPFSIFVRICRSSISLQLALCWGLALKKDGISFPMPILAATFLHSAKKF